MGLLDDAKDKISDAIDDVKARHEAHKEEHEEEKALEDGDAVVVDSAAVAEEGPDGTTIVAEADEV